MGERFKNLKGFINKQMADVKFRFAGTGRRLTDQTLENESSSNCEPVQRVEPSQEAQRAGQAALSRLVTSGSSQSIPVKKHIKIPQSSLVVPVCNETSSQGDSISTKGSDKEKKIETKEALVHFQCPLLGPDVLTHDEWLIKIKEYLEELISKDDFNPFYAVVLIKSINEPEKANFACEKLKACLQNIVDHPEEEKYKKIKANNTLFRDKLLPIYGCEQYLFLCGFDYATIDDVKYFIFQPPEFDSSKLQTCIDALDIAEPIQLVLDRNIQVIQDSKRSNVKETDDFFHLTTEEVRLEAARRQDEIEDMKILKTRAMREKPANFNYETIEYAEIKIKFPDGVHLQGTFKANETIQDVRQFVKENLKTKSESFNLLTGLGRNVLNPEKTLFEEKLIPSSLLHFEWNKELSSEDFGFLNDEVVAMYC